MIRRSFKNGLIGPFANLYSYSIKKLVYWDWNHTNLRSNTFCYREPGTVVLQAQLWACIAGITHSVVSGQHPIECFHHSSVHGPRLTPISTATITIEIYRVSLHSVQKKKVHSSVFSTYSIQSVRSDYSWSTSTGTRYCTIRLYDMIRPEPHNKKCWSTSTQQNMTRTMGHGA